MNHEAPAVLEKKLEQVFPATVVEGVIAPHDCVECDALQKRLASITWLQLPMEFVIENDDVLPLLSKEAYRAFLPAWLLASVRDPGGPNARILMVNLRRIPDTDGFTPSQAAAILETAKFIAQNSLFAPDDPLHVESLTEIERLGGPHATRQRAAGDVRNARA
jgi:hypothetical protein